MNLNDYMAELVRTRDTMRVIRDGHAAAPAQPWEDLAWHWPPAGWMRVRQLPVIVARKDNIDVLVRMRDALLVRAVPELYHEVFMDKARLVFLRRRQVRRVLGRPLTAEEVRNEDAA